MKRDKKQYERAIEAAENFKQEYGIEFCGLAWNSKSETFTLIAYVESHEADHLPDEFEGLLVSFSDPLEDFRALTTDD